MKNTTKTYFVWGKRNKILIFETTFMKIREQEVLFYLIEFNNIFFI